MHDITNYLFVLSILYRSDSGIAIVSAASAREAFTVLKRQGVYNGNPNEYILVQSKNIGMYKQERVTLVYESYTNALVAYDAIVSVMEDLHLESPIEHIKVNGTELEINDKTVNITVPTSLADLASDVSHRTVTDIEKSIWNSKADASAIPDVSGKADRVQSAVAGHIATLDSSGNLVDSGKGISDINPLWGNIQGSIENQTDLMSALGNKYEKPSTGIPESDIAAGVVPKTLHITSWTPTYASGGNDINLGTRTQAAATLGITVTQLDAMMEREYDSVILSGTEDQVLSASAFSDDAVFYTANAVSSWYGLQFYIDEIEYHCIALQEELPTVPTDVVKYSQQLLTEAQKKQARINIGATSKEIFWATYGTTTASEISAAISAGKFVIVNGSYGQAYYWNTTPVDIHFWGIAGVSVFYYIVNISDNSWSSNSKMIPEEQVNSDWDASSGKAQILNKPDLSTKAEKASTQAYSYGATAPSDPKEGDIWVSETLTEIPIPENANELTFTKTASRYKLKLEGLTGNDAAVFEWVRASDSEPFNSADYKPDGTYYFDAPDYEIEDNELYLSLTYTGDLWEVATLWAVANTVYQYHNGSWVAMEVVTATEKAAWNAKYSKPSGGIPSTDLASGVIPDVSNFITKSVNDLVNYYLKSETYTQTEVNHLIGAINQFHYEIAASTSAVTTPAANVLYLIGPTGSGADKYEEYVYSNSTWVKIGDTSIDLSGFVTTSDLDTALSAYTTSADLSDLLNAKQDVINDLDDIRDGAAAGATAYQKPQTGIPASDLAAGVIPTVPTDVVKYSSQSLTDAQKTQARQNIGAGTYSKPSGGIPAADIAAGVIPTVPTISTDIQTDKSSTTKTASPSAVYSEVHPAIATTQPSGGFLPNVVYDLGTITDTTFTLATPSDATIPNAYFWTFETSITAPTITWPANITWIGGSAPAVSASKHYEIMIRNGYANSLEFPLPSNS